MQVAVTGPIVESGVIAGNLEDKYGSRNPIAGALMQGFLNDVSSLVRCTGARAAAKPWRWVAARAC